MVEGSILSDKGICYLRTLMIYELICTSTVALKKHTFSVKMIVINYKSRQFNVPVLIPLLLVWFPLNIVFASILWLCVYSHVSTTVWCGKLLQVINLRYSNIYNPLQSTLSDVSIGPCGVNKHTLKRFIIEFKQTRCNIIYCYYL